MRGNPGRTTVAIVTACVELRWRKLSQMSGSGPRILSVCQISTDT